ncbi:MAG: transcriptional repressor [Coriobacteriia bacterium]|nr:transcriptional repressor [Coriobacteriia bacterium]MCL2745601.1 transcriptional repressor [Coriobacteriia bacterium]MCL2871320.1 transcriptional repressor [Coriobacteriia bacterium]
MSGRNYSKKREAILEKLQSTTSHPTAEWIYHELKTDYPKISLATVYRNLNQFRDEGVIFSLGQVLGKERFDATVARHDHFVCETCAAILDIPVTAGSDDLDPKVVSDMNISVSRHHTTYFGECSDCS